VEGPALELASLLVRKPGNDLGNAVGKVLTLSADFVITIIIFLDPWDLGEVIGALPCLTTVLPVISKG